jgi:hypothetical protein
VAERFMDHMKLSDAEKKKVRSILQRMIGG